MSQCYKTLFKILFSISSKCLIFIAVHKWCMFLKDEIGDLSFVQNMILQNSQTRKYGIKIIKINIRGLKLVPVQYAVLYKFTRQLMILYPSANKQTNKNSRKEHPLYSSETSFKNLGMVE